MSTWASVILALVNVAITCVNVIFAMRPLLLPFAILRTKSNWLFLLSSSPSTYALIGANLSGSVESSSFACIIPISIQIGRIIFFSRFSNCFSYYSSAGVNELSLSLQLSECERVRQITDQPTRFSVWWWWSNRGKCAVWLSPFQENGRGQAWAMPRLNVNIKLVK